jgi:hypothetical protein
VFKISFINLKIAPSVASPFLKPNWFSTNRLSLYKYSISLFYRAFSRAFEKDINKEMGLQLARFILSPFLYTGLTIENFNRSRKTPDRMTLLQM